MGPEEKALREWEGPPPSGTVRLRSELRGYIDAALAEAREEGRVMESFDRRDEWRLVDRVRREAFEELMNAGCPHACVDDACPYMRRLRFKVKETD